MAAAACGPSREPAPTCPPDVSDTLDVLQGVESIATRDYTRGLHNDHINFVAMDTQSGNKVLLTLYYHKEKDQLLGLSKSGKTLFTATDFSSQFCPPCTMTAYKRNIRLQGLIKKEFQSQVMKLMNHSLPCDSPNSELRIRTHQDKNLFYNLNDKVVAKVKKSQRMLTIEFYEPLTPAVKSLMLVALMRRQLLYEKFQNHRLTPTFVNMPTVYVPAISRYWPSSLLHRVALSSILLEDKSYYIRASNYCLDSDSYYLDIMSESTRQVLNNVKFEPNVEGGKLQWANMQTLCFTARGVTCGEAMEVNDAIGDILAYKMNDKVYNQCGSQLASIIEPSYEQGKCLEGQIVRSGTCSSHLCAVSHNRHRCAVEMRILNDVPTELRAFALAWAIRNYFNIYMLHQTPIPYIQEL
ncbi:hypothetical protein EB796_019623 [Bugula neritina]|uniref:Uncharacterized protein n=1 Tax=Bugula neritina TaxID=10212 RepID=A0A7J7J8M2_BUGNE|nr:hypothetical protein EB796_019623 [Bugula neritina]